MTVRQRFLTQRPTDEAFNNCVSALNWGFLDGFLKLCKVFIDCDLLSPFLLSFVFYLYSWLSHLFVLLGYQKPLIKKLLAIMIYCPTYLVPLLNRSHSRCLLIIEQLTEALFSRNETELHII